MVLVIDSSSTRTGLAVVDRSRVVDEQVGERLSVEELPEALAALTDPRRLSAVLITTGPGSFTGLRAGASYAIGLAQGRRIPLLGIPTLDLVRHLSTAPARAVVEAGRGRVYRQGPGGEVLLGGLEEVPRDRPLVGWLSPLTVAAAGEAGVPLLPEGAWRSFGAAAQLVLGRARELPYGRVKLSYVTSVGALPN